MSTQGSPKYSRKAALDCSTQPSSVPSLWGAIVGLRGCELSCSGAKRTTMASRAVARCRSARGRQRAGRRAARWCAEVHRRDGPRERCARERGATASHERRRLLSERARAGSPMSVCAFWLCGFAGLRRSAPSGRGGRRQSGGRAAHLCALKIGFCAVYVLLIRRSAAPFAQRNY